MRRDVGLPSVTIHPEFSSCQQTSRPGQSPPTSRKERYLWDTDKEPSAAGDPLSETHLHIFEIILILQPMRGWLTESARSGIKPWFCHLVVWWIWPSYLASLNLRSLICDMGLIIVYKLQMGLNDIKYAWKAHRGSHEDNALQTVFMATSIPSGRIKSSHLVVPNLSDHQNHQGNLLKIKIPRLP